MMEEDKVYTSVYDLIDDTLKLLDSDRNKSHELPFSLYDPFCIEAKDILIDLDLVRFENATERWFKKMYTISHNGIELVDSGVGSREWHKKLKEKKDIEYRKLKVDLQNAETTLRTYPTTRTITYFAFGMSIVALLIELYVALSKGH